MKTLKAYAWQLLALALAAVLLWQSLRLASAEVAEAKAKQALSGLIAGQALADKVETTKKAGALLEHATRNAQLAANGAAARDLADQHERLAGLAARGAGVVSRLGGLVEIRDAQVKALQGQVAVDGALLGRQ